MNEYASNNTLIQDLLVIKSHTVIVNVNILLQCLDDSTIDNDDIIQCIINANNIILKNHKDITYKLSSKDIKMKHTKHIFFMATLYKTISNIFPLNTLHKIKVYDTSEFTKTLFTMLTPIFGDRSDMIEKFKFTDKPFKY